MCWFRSRLLESGKRRNPKPISILAICSWVYVHIPIYPYMDIYPLTYTHGTIGICEYIHIIHIHTYAHMDIYLYGHIPMDIYPWNYWYRWVYTYTYTYIYVHTYTLHGPGPRALAPGLPGHIRSISRAMAKGQVPQKKRQDTTRRRALAWWSLGTNH